MKQRTYCGKGYIDDKDNNNEEKERQKLKDDDAKEKKVGRRYSNAKGDGNRDNKEELYLKDGHK